jgi:hypothetical protein
MTATSGFFICGIVLRPAARIVDETAGLHN